MNVVLNQPEKRNDYFLIISWGLFLSAVLFDFNSEVQVPVTAIYLSAIVLGLLYSKAKKQIFLMGTIACLLPFIHIFMAGMNWSEAFPNFLSRIVILGVVVSLSLKYRLEKERNEILIRNDPLTGVMNQPAFMDLLQSEMERSKRKLYPMTLVYIDCDQFRQVNELMGHPVGDEVIITVANTLKSIIRKYDLPGRMGGDEFCLLFPDTNHDQSRIIADRIRGELLHSMLKKRWDITFSLGVVTFYDIPETSKEAVTVVDRVMYQVKQSGKNGIKFQTVGTFKNEPEKTVSTDSF